MTQRLVLGLDPGLSGAIAVVADGVPVKFIDMPTRTRQSGHGTEVNVGKLQAELRGLRAEHRGAYCLAVVERVAGFRGQGGASQFAFGRADGQAVATIECLGIPILEVHPATWKTYFRLAGLEKDAARLLAINRYPAIATQLARKKDCGRADAVLIALWAELTEQLGRAA